MHLGAAPAGHEEERIGPVAHGVQATAVVGVLYEHDVVGVLGLVQLVPLVVDEEGERGGGDDAFEEEGGEDGGDDGLQALQDDGGEARGDAAGREGVGGAEEVRVYVGVEEGGYGEDDAEDGDDGGEGEGEVVCVVVDDAGFVRVG